MKSNRALADFIKTANQIKLSKKKKILWQTDILYTLSLYVNKYKNAYYFILSLSILHTSLHYFPLFGLCYIIVYYADTSREFAHCQQKRTQSRLNVTSSGIIQNCETPAKGKDTKK